MDLKKRKRGRPFRQQRETVKSERITVRLESSLLDKLQKFCDVNNIDESEGIRRAILRLPTIISLSQKK